MGVRREALLRPLLGNVAQHKDVLRAPQAQPVISLEVPAPHTPRGHRSLGNKTTAQSDFEARVRCAPLRSPRCGHSAACETFALRPHAEAAILDLGPRGCSVRGALGKMIGCSLRSGVMFRCRIVHFELCSFGVISGRASPLPREMTTPCFERKRAAYAAEPSRSRHRRACVSLQVYESVYSFQAAGRTTSSHHRTSSFGRERRQDPGPIRQADRLAARVVRRDLSLRARSHFTTQTLRGMVAAASQRRRGGQSAHRELDADNPCACD